MFSETEFVPVAPGITLPSAVKSEPEIFTAFPLTSLPVGSISYDSDIEVAYGLDTETSVEAAAIETALAPFDFTVFIRKYSRFAEPGFKYIDSGTLNVKS